jgi:tetratricopeptide (TPR) repeat protein
MRSPFAALLLVMGLPAFGADLPEPAPVHAAPAVDRLAAARGYIAAQRWPQAVAELKRLDDRANADWNNLMGYALRKQTPPDLDGAQRHYDAALRIAPMHRGALEYAGELALMKGDLATAQRRLAALVQACGAACEEHADLQRAIERYKAAGGRFVATP